LKNDEENYYETVENRPSSEAVGKLVEDAISTMQAEISEVDTMGFDEDIVPMETVDI
jgi:hypothetical protein